MSDWDWDAAEGISRTAPPSWDILICSVVHRTDMLRDLLGELKRQWVPNVGVRVCRDNIEIQYGDKCQKLLDSSSAEYVSFFDDDDWPAPDFVASINDALYQRPDYVGFRVRHTEDGVPQAPVYHTLSCGGWSSRPDGLYRDIVHFNPMRRELALTGRWEGGGGADIRWADQVRAAGGVATEVYIDREIHYYRKTGGQFWVPQPMLGELPPRPRAPRFVTWVE